MKHQKIIDDLMKDFGTPTRHPMTFPSYRAAQEFRAAETYLAIERKLYPPLCSKPAAYMNVHKTYFDGAGRERDGHGHIVMRAAERLTEDAKVREQVADVYRATIEKFFGLWEGALQPAPAPAGQWRIFDQAIDTSKPLPARRPSYYTALRWPGLYQ